MRTSAALSKERADARFGGFDAGRIRRDFPILYTTAHGKPLVYLDNAATSQKPQAVINALDGYYGTLNANVHRGVHYLSQRATDAYEAAREKARRFVGAAEARECLFVRGTTEAINLVAQSYGRTNVRAGDEVIISAMEHHSNIVPWQLLCEEMGATLRIIPMNDAGELLIEEFEALLTDRTRIVAVGHVSNALGTINPIKEIVEMAHRRDVPVLVDGAQGAPHIPIDVQDLGCDFYTVSGHKMFGPTGIGVLYGRAELLEAMPPYQGGGEMIQTVTLEKSTFAQIPAKFEAGTPNIADAIGLGATIDYLSDLDWDEVAAHEADLLAYATARLRAIPELRIYGTAKHKVSVVSFNVGDIHAHDLGTIVDQEGVAVRTGHHCAQPVMEFYGVAATARASFAFYNTRDDVDRLVDAIHKTREVFG